MEFDLDSFMSDVTVALQRKSPRPGKRPREDDVAEIVERISREGDEDPWWNNNAQTGRRLSPANEAVVLRRNRVLLAESDEEAEELIGVDGGNIFCPDLDMTTAILACRPSMFRNQSSDLTWIEKNNSFDARLGPELIFNPVPNFYSYAITACLLPIRKVQHELISLYFHYIHPMLPVVDEHHFTEIHQKYRGKEELMNPTDFMIYQAIMAAGFGHLSESQLQRTPYRSVHEGQEAQFDQVKARYWSQPTTDPFILTQICLIISLWSPHHPGVQNNSYWLNLAFKHATVGQLWKPVPSSPLDSSSSSSSSRPCRRRLLWWCCLVRDRVLAVGMRRPYRLHKAPYEESLISAADFGLEAKYPSYTDLQSKRIAIWAFVWLCKLSDIMAAIAVFQRQNRFSREWNGESVGESLAELEEATRFDRDLRGWKAEFEEEAAEVMRSHCDPDVLIPVSILRIVSDSVLACLYQPYLHLSGLDSSSSSSTSISSLPSSSSLPPSSTISSASTPAPLSSSTFPSTSTSSTSLIQPPTPTPSVDPLSRVKEGCQAVESSVMTLLSEKKSDSLPNWLVAWVGLPTAVYHVSTSIFSPSHPDKVLMPCLNRFMRRTTGAQAVFLVLTKATKEFLRELEASGQSHSLRSGRSDVQSPAANSASSAGGSGGFRRIAPAGAGLGKSKGSSGNVYSPLSSSNEDFGFGLSSSGAGSGSRGGGAGGNGNGNNSRERFRITEAKVLAHVTKALDSALELNC